MLCMVMRLEGSGLPADVQTPALSECAGRQ